MSADRTAEEPIAFDRDSVGSQHQNFDDDPHDDFFGVKQYQKKRSLSGSDVNQMQEKQDTEEPTKTKKNSPKSVEKDASAQHPGDNSEPKTSETKSNTDSNPTSQPTDQPAK